MTKNEIATEEKIIKAAKAVFHEKGYFGARMQEIADKAAINKAMLHYYFRSKDKLFRKILDEALSGMVSRLFAEPVIGKSLRELLEHFVDTYIDFLLENPQIPGFISQELHRNPELIKGAFVGKLDEKKPILVGAILKEIELGNIKKIPPYQIILSVISMSVFPFIGRPMLQGFFQLDDEAWNQMILDRKKLIVDIIFDGIENK